MPHAAHGALSASDDGRLDAPATMAGDAFDVEDGQRHRKIVRDAAVVRGALLGSFGKHMKSLRPVNI
jgi:hypothetical protein